MPEVTGRSVTLGLFFCALFAMAAAYLALKVGQGIEAAIPISILAIGISRFFVRRSTILENVIIQSIGANSSHVVAGAVFTIPALYMLGLNPTWYQVILTAFLGGCLGILFLVPLRYHFMVEQHGQLPWPEATATTEILVSGQKVGDQAKVLVVAALLGAVYDALAMTFHGWKERITLEAVYVGDWLQDKFMTLRIDNSAALIGIGYIVGLKYAAIICAGSFLSFFVMIPLVHAIGQHVPQVLPPGTIPIGEMSIDQIFTRYVRFLGIGGIAGAGIMGILSSLPAMIRSMAVGFKGYGSSSGKAVQEQPRTERSLSGPFTMAAILAVLAGAFLFFSFGISAELSLIFPLVGVGMCAVIAFLFAPVSARAIAIVGTNPVSGMTLLTLIVTGVVMVNLGLEGDLGMTVVMIMGGVVCTALCASGALASDLKIGHWIGATPRNQLLLKFLGTLVAASFCGLAMWVMYQAYGSEGFGNPDILPAPQASAMRAVLEGIMGTTQAPLQWSIFALGVLLAIILRMAGVPPLAFALGMYLPIQLNVPVLIGGFLAWVVGRERKGEDEKKTKAGHNRGILIASGLMAGGAIWGVINAGIDGTVNAITGSMEKTLEWKEKFLHFFFSDETVDGFWGESVSIVVLLALCAFIVIYARKAEPEKDSDEQIPD
jgi:putative OPT family oligopeptide transporter